MSGYQYGGQHDAYDHTYGQGGHDDAYYQDDQYYDGHEAHGGHGQAGEGYYDES